MKKNGIILLSIVAILLIFGLRKWTTTRNIYVYITVDWEGVDFKDDILNPKDLNKIQRFRSRFSNYPLVHYLNAAYYTNGALTESEVSKRMKTVIQNKDQLGLHIHPWQNLTNAANVKFISGPTYFGYEKSPPVGKGSPKYPQGQRGGDVPLWRYPKEDIKRLIRFSLKKLKEHGFSNITSFRAGGWMADSKVLDALIEEGFQSESSPIPCNKIENLYPDSVLARYTKKLWQNIQVTSRPYKYKNKLVMWPNNACLADYIDSQEFMEIVKKNLAVHKSDIHIVYGFHIETAVEYLGRVAESLTKLDKFAEKNNLKVIPSTFDRVNNPFQ